MAKKLIKFDTALQMLWVPEKPETEAEKALVRARLRVEEVDSSPGSSLVDRLKAQRDFKFALVAVWYADEHPRDIPVDLMKEIAGFTTSKNGTIAAYKQKVKSPLTAIRAFCIVCQGGTPSYVSDCTAVTCQLYPFRMGNNPFFGKLKDADKEAEDADLAAQEPAERHFPGDGGA